MNFDFVVVIEHTLRVIINVLGFSVCLGVLQSVSNNVIDIYFSKSISAKLTYERCKKKLEGVKSQNVG